MTIRNLDRLFRPKSVAVIGASTQPGKLGHMVFQALRQSRFQGALYAVNPKAGMIDGEPVLPSLAALPAAPDLAVIVTPAPTVAAIVAQLGAMGCKAGIVLSAGFGEGQDGQGLSYRTELLAAAKPHLFRIIGPNCVGVMVPDIGLNASFVRTPAQPGRLALVAQSGAVAATVLDWAAPRGIGFSHVVTLGDMADVDFGDMLDYLCDDKDTRAVLLYVEGITHPRKFMSAARRAARLKPVIAVKGGRQAESAKVATSHTGALAGADAVYDAVFKRAGILRVDDLDDLFASAELLSSAALVTGDRLAIVTNGGGLGVLAADRLIAEHGRLAALSPAGLAQLNQVLPATWSRGNPVDIIGDATPERYRRAVEVVLNDPENDGVLVLHCPTSACDPRAAAKVVADLAGSQPAKPLLTAWTGEASVGDARADLARARIATFSTPRDAVTGFMQLVRYRRLQDVLMEVPPSHDSVQSVVVQEARTIVSQLTEKRWLSVDAVKRLLRLYGIPTNRSTVALTPTDAKRIAVSWRCRVALKVHSPDIVHKSDVDGVVLDVDPMGVEIEAQHMLDAVRRHAPDACIEGILVEEMVKRPDAREVFIGMTSDVTFGPVLAFGQGGTGIEVINDKSFGLPPLNMNLAASMIAETRVGRLLAGYRNRPAANTAAIARALISLSQLVTDHPTITDVDLNPLLVDANGLIAVDARIKVDPAAPDSRMIISPYPRELERTLTRPTGPPLHVRPLQPHDTPLIEEFVRRLSPEDRRFRFFAALRGLDHKAAARLCQLDYDRELALIATLTPGGRDIVGVARFYADPDNTQAEFAIAVRSDVQRQGIGYSLLSCLSEVAANRGIKSLWGAVLADNPRMVGLASALGMQVAMDGDTVRVVRDLTASRR